MEARFVSNKNPFTSSKKLGLSLKLTLICLRHFFKIMNLVIPSFAERLALRLFLTPPRNQIPDWHKPFIAKASTSTIMVNDKLIKLYQWGEGPLILLIHGWGGRGSQFSAFIDTFLEAGYSILTFDGPAHGLSTGKQTDMFEFASVIKEVVNIHQSLHAVVAHSFGGACTLLALREYQIKIPKLILIGCPSSAIWVTEQFADRLSISRKLIAGMRKQLEYRYGNSWTWEDLSLTKMLAKSTNLPTLLIHDRNDLEVPYQQALELKHTNPICELYTSEGHGHRRILRSLDVINKITLFISH